MLLPIHRSGEGCDHGSIAGVSPRFTARMAGLFYLLVVDDELMNMQPSHPETVKH